MDSNIKSRSLRKATTLLTAALIVMVLVVGALWIWRSHSLHAATALAVRDTESTRLARELERNLYLAHRLENVHAATGGSEAGIARLEAWSEIWRLLAEVEALEDSEAEHELLESIAGYIFQYVEQRRALEQKGSDLETMIRETLPMLNEALARTEALRQINASEVQRDSARADAIERAADIAVVGVVVLIVLAVILCLLAVRQRILLPLFELHDAVERLRRGEVAECHSSSGLREIEELTRAYNELVTALGQQREAQLAALAGIAHDLRNPLSALKLAAQTLDLATNIDEKQARTTAILLRQVDRLARMVDDLADVTVIEAGELAIQQAEVDIESAIGEIVDLYAPTTDKHEFVVNCEDGTLTVWGDPHRIQQVFGNLINNAIKYSPDGGRIEVSCRAREGQAVVRVVDEGVGISAEQLSNVFLPFRRLRPDVAPGSGLGLSVVRRIVQAHGGTVDVRSEEGRGTTVEVTFPLAAPPGHASALAASASA